MGPKIAVSYPTDRRRANPVKRRLFRRMGAWADVTLLDPRREHPDLIEAGFDLYHMARQRRPALADLERANRGGVRTVNSYAGVELLSDRLRCLERLGGYDVRVPNYAYGACEDIDLEAPVVIKRREEIDDESHRIVTVLDGGFEFPGTRLVERHIPGRRHVKLHRLGGESRAVEFADAAGTAPRERAPTRQMTSIADRIGELTGMTVFEVDFVGDGELYVVDVNSAVSVTGVEDGKRIYEDVLYDLATK